MELNFTLDQPTLSVCVCLKNRSRIVHDTRELTPFPHCVRSLADAAGKLPIRYRLELVVVDYRSDDWPLSAWFADAVGALPARVITHEGEFSKGEGLNFAVQTARSDLLFLCDADMLIVEPLLQRGLELLEQRRAFFPIAQRLNLQGDFQDLDLHGYGNAFVTRRQFDRAGGVPPFRSWGGEDDIFYRRVSQHAIVHRESVPGFYHQWHPEHCRDENYARARKSDFREHQAHRTARVLPTELPPRPQPARADLPFMTCLCATYMRPELLANVIHCFEQFEYPKDRCRLIVLDDLGQFPTQPAGENWNIVSRARRFPTLGEKRNALADLAPADSDAFVVIDDDDVYLPWTLRAHAWALERSEWSCPDRVLVEDCDGSLLMEPAQGRFHAAWAYSRSLFRRSGGYPSLSSGEDHEFQLRLRPFVANPVSATEIWPPWYLSRWSRTGSYHMSSLGNDRYPQLLPGEGTGQPVTEFRPCPLQDWTSLASAFLELPTPSSQGAGNVVESWRTSRFVAEQKMVQSRGRFVALRQVRQGKSPTLGRLLGLKSNPPS